MRFSLPDSRQIIPAVATSADGVEERTIVLAVERNTKYLDPMIHDQMTERDRRLQRSKSAAECRYASSSISDTASLHERSGHVPRHARSPLPTGRRTRGPADVRSGPRQPPGHGDHVSRLPFPAAPIPTPSPPAPPRST